MTKGKWEAAICGNDYIMTKRIMVKKNTTHKIIETH
jgi:hypothetical protein